MPVSISTDGWLYFEAKNKRDARSYAKHIAHHGVAAEELQKCETTCEVGTELLEDRTGTIGKG
jgi:hypothetical protein